MKSVFFYAVLLLFVLSCKPLITDKSSPDSASTSMSTTKGTTEAIAAKYLKCVHASRDGARIYVGTENGLALSNDHGNTWVMVGENAGIKAVDTVVAREDGSWIYTGSIEDGLVISRDHGKTWRAIAAVPGDMTKLQSNKIKTLFVNPSNLIVYAAAGNDLAISADENADSWQTVKPISERERAISGIYAQTSGSIWTTRLLPNGIDFLKLEDSSYSRKVLNVDKFSTLSDIFGSQDGLRIYVSSWINGLIFTKDGGANWQQVSPGGQTCVSHISASDDGSLISVATAGKIFASSDEGNSWQELSSNAGSFQGPKANIGKIHVSFSGDRIYVPSRNGLFIGTKVGSDWNFIKIPNQP